MFRSKLSVKTFRSKLSVKTSRSKRYCIGTQTVYSFYRQFFSLSVRCVTDAAIALLGCALRAFTVAVPVPTRETPASFCRPLRFHNFESQTLFWTSFFLTQNRGLAVEPCPSPNLKACTCPVQGLHVCLLACAYAPLHLQSFCYSISSLHPTCASLSQSGAHAEVGTVRARSGECTA